MLKISKSSSSLITVSVASVCIFFLTTILTFAGEVQSDRGSGPFLYAVNRYNGVQSGQVPKIIGGENAKWSNNKWQVALLVSWIADPVSAQFCGGSLLRQDWVVTAAHCVDNGTLPENVHVLTGTADLSSGGKRSNIDAIYIHKDYDPATHDNDIALLKLRGDGVGDPITPVTPAQEPDIVQTGQNAIVTGWGVTESRLPSPKLKQVPVPLVDREKCNGRASYDGAITERMICAGRDEGGQDSCQGDSGGPCTKGGFLIGIVSWGEGCAKAFKYGVYTRVSQFAAWIDTCVKDSASCK